MRSGGSMHPPPPRQCGARRHCGRRRPRRAPYALAILDMRYARHGRADLGASASKRIRRWRRAAGVAQLAGAAGNRPTRCTPGRGCAHEAGAPIRQLYDALLDVMQAQRWRHRRRTGRPAEVAPIRAATVAWARAGGRGQPDNKKVAMLMLARLGYRARRRCRWGRGGPSRGPRAVRRRLMTARCRRWTATTPTAAIRRLEACGASAIIAMTANAMEGDRERCLARDGRLRRQTVKEDELAAALGRGSDATRNRGAGSTISGAGMRAVDQARSTTPPSDGRRGPDRWTR